MKVIIPTHDKFQHLVEPHSVLFSRYCTGHDLVYAKQSGPPQTWAQSLRAVVESLDEDYILLIMEDVMLMSPVDQDDLNLLIEKVATGGASKALLDSHLNGETYPHVDLRFLELSQKSKNRTSLHPAIWRRDYLLKFLLPGFSPWAVEATGGAIAVNDGALIVSLNSPRDLFYTANVYRKGVPFPRHDCPRPYGTSGHYVNLDDAEYIRRFIDE